MTSKQTNKKRKPPAKSPEARENQLIALAYNLAEKQLAEGTASSQVITHFLKLGSTRERLEKDALAVDIDLKNAKKKSIDSGEREEELYKEVLEAMRLYSGTN